MSAGAAAAAAAITQAIRASGVVVRVEPGEFLRVVERQQGPLVVRAPGRFFFRTSYQYLTSYKGLAFFTKSPEPLSLPPGSGVVQAGSISVPG